MDVLFEPGGATLEGSARRSEVAPIKRVQSRVVYADPRGNVRVRWRGDTEVADLWRKAARKPREAGRRTEPLEVGVEEEPPEDIPPELLERMTPDMMQEIMRSRRR